MESVPKSPTVSVGFSTVTPPTPDSSLPPPDLRGATKTLARPIWTTPRLWPWRPVALAFWLGGAGVWWGIVGLCALRFRRLVRSARPASHELEDRMKHLAARSEPAPGSDDRHRTGPNTPLALGPLLGTPHLLLPEALWARFDIVQQETVLLHELAHLERRDHWVRRLEALVMGLYWWDPIAWWARRELERAEEECCDAWVVRALPGAVTAYAEALVSTAVFLSGLRQTVPVGASGAGGTLPLKRRLNMILCHANAGPLRARPREPCWCWGYSPCPFYRPSPREQAGGPSQAAPKAAQPPREPAKIDRRTAGTPKEIALDPDKPSEKVRICQPIVREVSDYIVTAGKLEAAHTVQLRARVSGTIVNVYCRLGQIVKANDPLFRIDPRPYEAERDKAEAEVRRAAARSKRLTSQLAGTKKLAQNKSISVDEVVQAESEFEEAEASKQAALAESRPGATQVGCHTCASPIAGTISGSVLDAGSVVTADTTVLAIIIALDPMYVVFSLDQSTVLRLKSKSTKQSGLVRAHDHGQSLRRGRFRAHGPCEFRGSAGGSRRRSPMSRGHVESRWHPFSRIIGASARGDERPSPGPSDTGESDRELERRPHVDVVNDITAIESRRVKVGLVYDGLRTVTAGLKADDWIVADAPRPEPPAMQ